MPAMMPERLAMTDPFKQIPEVIGSGPFRYVAAERLQGVRNVYARFDGYVPRPDGRRTAGPGPKIVHFERVVWTTMPDQGIALAALQTGEQDWWEFASADLLPLIRRDRPCGARCWRPRATGLRAVQSSAAAVRPAGDAPRDPARGGPGGFRQRGRRRAGGIAARGGGVFSAGAAGRDGGGAGGIRPPFTAEQARAALAAAGIGARRSCSCRRGITPT